MNVMEMPRAKITLGKHEYNLKQQKKKKLLQDGFSLATECQLLKGMKLLALDSHLYDGSYFSRKLSWTAGLLKNKPQQARLLGVMMRELGKYLLSHRFTLFILFCQT